MVRLVRALLVGSPPHWPADCGSLRSGAGGVGLYNSFRHGVVDICSIVYVFFGSCVVGAVLRKLLYNWW